MARTESGTREDGGGGFVMLVFVLITACLASLSYLFWIIAKATGREMEIFGQEGEFFGGFLGPTLTALTLLGFLYTVFLQRTELRESRVQFKKSVEALSEQNKAIREQNYQTGFFQLLAMYNDIVNSISVSDPNTKVEIKGRDAFRVIYTRMVRIYREKVKKIAGANESAALTFAYDEIYREEQSQIAHYFRYLFNTIIMLENGPDASKYIKILRSQISNQELLVLYYNCAVSQYGLKFKALAERHQLFNNIPPYLIKAEHGDLLAEGAFGPGGYGAVLRAGAPRMRGDLTHPQPRARKPRAAAQGTD